MIALQAVLFDYGSTLAEFEGVPWPDLDAQSTRAGHQYLREQLKASVPIEEWTESVRRSFDERYARSTEDLREFTFEEALADAASRCGVPLSDGDLGRLARAAYAPITDQVRLLPGASAVLDYLISRGVVVGLVSNTIFPERFHLAELERFGLLGRLQFTIFSCSFGWRKPHPRIYAEALARAGAPDPTGVAFVGDRLLEDVDGPQKAGMTGVLMHRGGRDYSADVAPAAVIHDLAELPRALEGLFRRGD